MHVGRFIYRSVFFLLVVGMGALTACRSEGEAEASQEAVAEALASTDSAVADTAVASPPHGTPSASEDGRRSSRTDPSARPENVTYTTFRSEHFGYSIAYPSNVLHLQEAPADERTHVFVSGDGQARMVVQAVPGATERTLNRRYQDVLNDGNQEVTYQTKHDDWFVVSGYVRNRIFYERARLEDETLAAFRIEYPQQERAYFYPIVEHISYSFD